MNLRSTRILAVIAAALLLGVLLVNVTEESYEIEEQGLLLPGLEQSLGAVTAVRISQGESSVTLERGDRAWTVADRDGYPADVAALRSALVALAEAGKLEAKTANPDRHEALGLAGEESTRVSLAGDDVDTAVILGSVAQQSNRYARLDDEDRTWLIDRNPELPAEPTEWLVADLVDVKAADVASVEIRHADGETVRIARDPEADRLAAENLPEGRELSYASVVNPIGGALANLELEDVRPVDGVDAEADVTTAYRTQDGLVVTLGRHLLDEESWFAIEAGAEPPAEEAAVEPDESADGEDAGETGDEEAGPATPSPEERAAEINATTSGWLYRLPDYKSEQLTKRWEDLLAPLEEDGDAE